MSDSSFPSDFWHQRELRIKASIDAANAKKGAEEFDAAAKKIKKSQDNIKGTTKITTEFDTKGFEKLERSINTLTNKIDKLFGGLGKNIGNTLGHNLEKSFSSPTVTRAVNGIGDRIKTTLAKSMIAGTAQARGELAQNIKALQKSVVDPINEMIDFKSVKTALTDIANSGEMKRFMEVMEMMSGDRLADNLKQSLSSLRGLSLRDKRLLGLLNQDTYNLSDKGSKQIASDLAKQEKARTALLKPLYQAQTKEANANARHAENQDAREQRAEERELRKEAEQRQKAEQQRMLRQRLYRENVGIAVANASDALANTSDPSRKRLIDNYNRSVARIRGIYQSAVVHGRVENPETIQAGVNELQRRSLDLNNYRIETQIGIKAINDELKTTVRRFEDMGTRWNKISSVIQNSVQAFATIQTFAHRITSVLTSFSRNVLTRITSQVRSVVKESTAAFKSLEVSLIGFKNFFGEESTDRLYQRIKSIAARAPGLATTDLADYVRQIAPVSGHNADLALNASLGMLKTIQYGGASGSTEMEYVIKNIRDVLAKGKATAIDIRQFNRAMPILEEVLGSVGQSQLLKDGVLTINKDNVDTILTAFAALNTSNQSAVKDIFSQMNQTLSGQWEQFREQFTTNLMEALRGSQAYGGVQNLLSQVNEGEYVNFGLRKLQEALTQFINGINWFKVQRIAGEVWDGLKTIWEGFEDAIESIKTAVGTTQTKSVIQSFSGWIADIIRGIGDGIAQVIRFIKRLEGSGVMNLLSRAIGWFGSIGASLAKLTMTLVSHISNIAGNVMQLISRYKKLNLTRQLESRQTQLDAIPLQYRSQITTAGDLLNGGKSPAVTQEVQAINNLSSAVTSHLSTIETNQVESQQIARQSLQTSTATGYRVIGGRVYPDTFGQKTRWTPNSTTYSRANEIFGETRQITSELAGGRVVATVRNVDEGGHAKLLVYNPKTGKYDEQTYDNTLKAYQAQKATAAQLNGANFLQRSDSALLRKLGNNKVVTSTIKTFEKAGKAVKNFATNLMTGLMQGGAAVAITEVITALVESLNIFGDATTYIAGVIKAAGFAIAGAMIGGSIPGLPGGGIIGALAGLGIGIAQLVKTVQDKATELQNTKVQKALDEGRKEIVDTVKNALIETGALTAELGKRSNEENYALQQLSRIIANSSTGELQALGAEGLVDVYGDALRYKTIQENFTNKNEGYGYDWTQHVGGKTVTKEDKEYLQMIYDMVNKYDLLASHGYEQGLVEGQRVYVDNSGNPISAETIWDEFFNTQDGLDTVTSKQIEDMQVYLQTQEQQQMTEWQKIEAKLDGISNTPGQSWYDTINAKLSEVNQHLLSLVLSNPTKEGVQAIYGGNSGESFENYQSASNIPLFDSGYSMPNVGKSLGFMDGEDISSGMSSSGKKAELRRVLSQLGYEVDALDYLDDEQAGRIFDFLRNHNTKEVSPEKMLEKLSRAIANESDIQKRGVMTEAMDDLSGFYFRTDGRNILWWLRLLLENEKRTGVKFFARGGLLTPVYRGVDTVPAMLSPGEFVMKQSAVKKAGLGMMYALNRGDLGAAARSLAGSVNNNWYRNNNASINNSRSTKTNINNFKIINKNASARLNSYYSLANRLSF